MSEAPSPITVLVTAAGSSGRFGGGKKELLKLEDRSILDCSISPFLGLPGLQALVVTSPAGREAELEAALRPESLAALRALGTGRFAIVAGGPSRRDSVRLGLEKLSEILGEAAEISGTPGVPQTVEAIWASTVVLVHDGARPWASPELAARVLAAAAECGAAVPILPFVDTPKEVGPDGIVLRHPPRSSLGGAQTPQGFGLEALLGAHRRALAEGFECTDDAELWDRYVGPVRAVPGELDNRKVTYPRDLPASLAPDQGGLSSGSQACRVGQGWDLHRLVPGRPLLLGGVELPSEAGEDAHSDGDVLLHAVIDALLGAAALGDIGTHFPPADERWRGADSADLARRAAALVREAGWEPGNLDCTVVLERPRLAPYREAIAESLASCLGLRKDAVSIKAKTKEGVDAVGEGRAVEAYSIATLFPRRPGPGA